MVTVAGARASGGWSSPPETPGSPPSPGDRVGLPARTTTRIVKPTMVMGGRTPGSIRGAWGVLLVAAVAAGADETAASRVIRYGDDALTVHVVNVPVMEVLAEIGRQSGAGIRGSLREGREVSAQFDEVPLPQALSRLLGDQNYALVYGRGGKLRAVKLLGGPAGDTVPVALAAARPPGDLAPLLEHQVRVIGPVADALGSPMVSLQQLGDLWLQSDDASLRGESASTAFRAMEAQPDIRNSLVDLTQTYSDAELAQLLRGFAGQRAEELASFIASQTRVTELHMKASSVLQLLQSNR
jgi:hypothetical protein